MDPSDVEREYAELLGSLRAHDQPGGAERRLCPRFQVRSEDLWINEVPHFSVVDLSATGIAIASTYPLQPGERIAVGLAGDVSTRAEVIGCTLVDSPTLYYPAEFRINCRFKERSEGMELLVRAKHRERQP
jgi:PilZ domain